jgi:hypothetical protein
MLAAHSTSAGPLPARLASAFSMACVTVHCNKRLQLVLDEKSPTHALPTFTRGVYREIKGRSSTSWSCFRTWCSAPVRRRNRSSR